ncbi:MAG TPA: hypothetical protein VFU31_15070 [Candidatus Binatia bacterium]|nr:hypothetical protein [Candidatus Binatia bacterium]
MADPISSLLYQTSLVGCLLGAVATLYFLGGLAGSIHSPVLNLAVAISLVAASIFFLCHFLAAARETNWVGRILWLSALVIVFVEIVLGLVPPIARDELTHHLAIPRLYTRTGRISEIPMAPYSYYPMLLDMLYTPWIYWGYDFVPKLVHGLFGWLTGLALYAYLSRRMNVLYGLLGFFFFLSLPAVLRLSHWAYVDLGTTYYVTAALLCIVRWLEERESRSWLILAALSAGFSVATKPNGLLAWVLLFLLFALFLAKQPERGWGKISSDLAVFGISGWLPCLPWLLKNWFQTGNPFFPLLAGFFSSSSVGEPGGEKTFVGLDIFAKRELLYGESGWQIAALPLRIFFSGQDDNPQYFDGVLSPILILLLPWAFKGKWIEEKKLFISFALLFLLYAFFLADLRIRYVLPIVPPLIMLLIYGVFNIYLRIKRPVYLFAILLSFAGLHGAYLWNYFRDVSPAGYLLGRESREAYLERRLAEYPAYRYINQELPSTAKIYLLFVGRRAYYCDRDYFHDGGELPAYLLNAVQSANDPMQIEAALERRGITHLLAREDLLQEFLSHNLSVPQQRVWRLWAARHLQLLFRDRGYSVHRIHD